MARSTPIFTTRFFVTLFLVGIGSFLIHELAHWLAGVGLGYDMVATPNHVWPKTAMSVTDQVLVSGAGPLLTIAQALLGFWLVRSRSSHFGFALVYVAFFMRLLAAGVSLFNPNDEARISQMLGLGTWTLPALVVIGLLMLVVSASRQLRTSVRDQFFCYLVSSIAVTLIVGVDMALWGKT